MPVAPASPHDDHADHAARQPQLTKHRVTKRRAQTRTRLLEAGFKVWAERGFWQTRVEEICAEAGYTRGAFYSNFDSLDDLFFALYEQQSERITAHVTAVLASDVGSAETTAALIQRTAAALPLDREWLMIRTEYLLHAARNPVIAARLTAQRAQQRAVIERVLQQAASRVRLPAAIPGIPDAARAVIAAHEGVAAQFLLDGDEPAARQWLTHLLTAILADPTH
jgi:AcrR family transcriptional regulator